MTGKLSFDRAGGMTIFAANENTMDTIRGIDALKRAEAVSKTGGSFSLAFFPYSRKRAGAEQVELRTFAGCTMRLPLPQEKWELKGKHYFLFLTEDGQPRSCYRVLIRYIGFSDEQNKLYRVIWYE